MVSCDIRDVPRTARIVLLNTPHHVTQRGSRRGVVFFNDNDRKLYLNILKKNADKYGVLILAYCLMDNHVHHLLVPTTHSSLAQTLSATHVRYSQVVNGRENWTGHLWQQRFYSSPLDEDFMWTALKYIERNPVKARIIERAWDYEWSSTKGHCGIVQDPFLTNDEYWVNIKKKISDWKEWVDDAVPTKDEQFLKLQTLKHKPCGSHDFLMELEKSLNINILPKQPGRPNKK